MDIEIVQVICASKQGERIMIEVQSEADNAWHRFSLSQGSARNLQMVLQSLLDIARHG